MATAADAAPRRVVASGIAGPITVQRQVYTASASVWKTGAMSKAANTEGIGENPMDFVDQGIERCHVTLHFEDGNDEIKLPGDTLRKMAGSQSLNLRQAHIVATSNFADGVQSLVIRNGDQPLSTNQRQFVAKSAAGQSYVQASHVVIGPGNHNKAADPHVVHLSDSGPMTEQDHHRNMMARLKWASLEDKSVDDIMEMSNIIEASHGEGDAKITRYAVPVNAAKGPFPALLASKSPAKRKEMLPRSDLTHKEINGEDHYILHEHDLKQGLSAFAQATTGSEVGSKSLTFKRSGDTSGDLIVHTVITREPHPDCKPHDHLEGVRTKLKVSDVADKLGGVTDNTSTEQVQKSAAAAAIFGSEVNVKDSAARKKVAATGAMIVSGGFDGAGADGAEADGPVGDAAITDPVE